MVSPSMLVQGMNDEQSLYKPLRIIPYHISICLAERDKDAYEAVMEADSSAGTRRRFPTARSLLLIKRMIEWRAVILP